MERTWHLDRSDEIGDAGDLLRHGTPIVVALVVRSGYDSIRTMAVEWAWDRTFGLGTSHGQVNPTAAYVMLALVVVIVALELAF